MRMFPKILTAFFLLLCFSIQAQPVFKETTQARREKLYAYLLSVIDKNLKLPLDRAQEESWAEAFSPLQLLQKHDSFIDVKISAAVQQISTRSIDFQYALLELLYANYPHTFKKEIRNYLQTVKDVKCFALAAEYFAYGDSTVATKKWLSLFFKKNRPVNPDPFFSEAAYHLLGNKISPRNLDGFTDKNYLKNNVLIISFQRKNRNYPGIVIVRDTAGNFITDTSGHLWYTQQLARSISGLPYYFSGGNTPQGLYRMGGYGISKSTFIGPTKNIQMTMPFEKDATHFMKDSTLSNQQMDLNKYCSLLPLTVIHSTSMLESFYAGFLGRNEIIAHGTAVDINWYNGKSYYPFTPTAGCLATKEIWDSKTGQLLISGQKELTDAVEKAGGPDGYVMVIDIDDQQIPVTAEEVYRLLNNL